MESGRVALSLGGGGARGYAHIGAIQVLEERGFEIVGVSGSSMGALVGAMYAAGALPEYTDWVLTLNRLQVMRLARVSLGAGGFFTADGMLDRMAEMLGGQKIEDFRIPFTAVATDMLARKPVWFQSGPVDVAIRASIAIPGFFTPVVLDGRVLVDGGVVDPVPMAPLASVPADLTLAVMLSGERAIAARPVGAAVGTAAELDPHPKPDSAEGEDVEAKASAGQAGKARSTTAAPGRAPAAKGTDGDARIGRSGAELADAGGSGGVATDAELADPDKDSSGDRRFFGLFPTRDDDTSEAAIAKAEAKAARAEAKSLDFGTMEVVNLSYEVMQDIVTRFRFAAFPPDVLVTIPKDACTVLDFHRAEELIALGRQLTEQALDAWAPSA